MDKNKELLICSGTGSGKTLTAVTISQCYLDKYPDGHVIVVMPAILVGNFQKEILAYGAIIDNRYTFYSFEKFITQGKRAPVDCGGHTLLIVDEAHNLRTAKSERFKSVLKCAERAHKKVLLTATPFVNNINDLFSLLKIMHGAAKVNAVIDAINMDRDDAIAIKELLKLMDNKIALMAARQHDEEYPTSSEHYVPVKPSRDYAIAYRCAVEPAIQQKLVEQGKEHEFHFIKNPEAFMHGMRKAVNQVGDEYYSSKLERAVQLIKHNKSIIYTNWLEYGIKPIVKILKARGISYREFHGGIPKAARAQTIKDYNADKFQVLIITKAGAEGIDLKGTRNIVVLEPTWNDAALRQIIGRAIRFRSHAHLPANQRHVDVYKMVMLSRSVIPLDRWKYDKTSGDVLLYKIIENKKKQEQKILNALMDASILD